MEWQSINTKCLDLHVPLRKGELDWNEKDMNTLLLHFQSAPLFLSWCQRYSLPLLLFVAWYGMVWYGVVWCMVSGQCNLFCFGFCLLAFGSFGWLLLLAGLRRQEKCSACSVGAATGGLLPWPAYVLVLEETSGTNPTGYFQKLTLNNNCPMMYSRATFVNWLFSNRNIHCIYIASLKGDPYEEESIEEHVWIRRTNSNQSTWCSLLIFNGHLPSSKKREF
jgi:hypothetical protein